MKYRIYKKMMAGQKKSSMKTTEDDLKGLIKQAVKEAMEEGDESKEDPVEKEIVTDDISGLVAEAIEAVNAKRKLRKEDPMGEDVTEEILEAIAESQEADEESEGKEETVVVLFFDKFMFPSRHD